MKVKRYINPLAIAEEVLLELRNIVDIVSDIAPNISGYGNGIAGRAEEVGKRKPVNKGHKISNFIEDKMIIRPVRQRFKNRLKEARFNLKQELKLESNGKEIEDVEESQVGESPEPVLPDTSKALAILQDTALTLLDNETDETKDERGAG